jgi:hypothetical protein
MCGRVFCRCSLLGFMFFHSAAVCLGTFRRSLFCRSRLLLLIATWVPLSEPPNDVATTVLDRCSVCLDAQRLLASRSARRSRALCPRSVLSGFALSLLRFRTVLFVSPHGSPVSACGSESTSVQDVPGLCVVRPTPCSFLATRCFFVAVWLLAADLHASHALLPPCSSLAFATRSWYPSMRPHRCIRSSSRPLLLCLH